MRYSALFVAALFLLTAALQLNDPDPFAWTLAYLTVAVLWGLAAFGRYYKPFTALVLMLLTIWMFTLTPDLAAWVDMGMPTLVGSMQAELPHIELVREFGGLFMAVASLVFLLRLGRRQG